MPDSLPSNDSIAALLDLIADHLAAKDENPFRVRSYRTAAASVRSSKSPIGKIVKENGSGALKGVPGVGERLAGLIEEYVKSGEVELLESLRKEVTPEDLEKVRTAKKEHPPAAPGALLIPVPLILDIDAEYREKAGARKLKLIAPKLLNPEKKAWLPILAATRKGWKFTVMFSNTATAHKLARTNDWVVVYYESGKGENQCTVVTEQRGPMKGKRVIRGREAECKKFYGLE
ncbi:MAG TPA: helix-hairpin-helix domain-containing protein [Bacteroidota bacterium]